MNANVSTLRQKNYRKRKRLLKNETYYIAIFIANKKGLRSLLS